METDMKVHIRKDAEGGIWAVVANVDDKAVQRAIDEATAAVLAAAVPVSGGTAFSRRPQDHRRDRDRVAGPARGHADRRAHLEHRPDIAAT